MCSAKMSGWAGFSDAELQRIQQKDPPPATRGRRAAPGGRSRQQIQREKALQMAAGRSPGAGAAALSLPPEQQLTRPPLEAPRPAGPPAAPAELQPAVKLQAPAALEEPRPAAVKELDRQEAELREKTRLELLQQEQKMMEEKNKRKKALLAKTIAEKSKQTQAEAVKLQRIQKELQALDDMVSSDIGILRDRIEQASWEYCASRKRYEKAEAEYVAAKLELHRKTELKEQLTEHLCAIIQENEQRKALKLEQLMQQLQLQEGEEQEAEQQQKVAPPAAGEDAEKVGASGGAALK